MASMRDDAALAKAGFTMAFPQHLLRRLTVESPEVRYEDALATQLGLLCTRICIRRTGSMLMWSSQYPYMLARISSVSARSQALSEFKRDVKARWAGKEDGAENTVYMSTQQ